MIKRILAGVCDPLYTASVARHSTELAQRFSAHLTGISVTDIDGLTNIGPVAVGAETFRQEMIEDRLQKNDDAIRQSVDVLTRICEQADVDYRVHEAGGSPYQVLLDASRYHDLMVFGLSGLFEHGVVDEPPNELVQLIESGVHPILAVNAEFREIKRVLVAYSGSIESARTIRDFVQMNLWPDAELKLVNFGKRRDGSGPVLLSELQDYFAAHGRKVEIQFIEGSPKKELLIQSESWNADLIVVGNSAKSLLRRRVFGETALTAMRESKIPLFLSQ